MKRLEFELNDSIYQDALLPIRNRYDLLKLLTKTIKFLITTPPTPMGVTTPNKKLILYIDKMSRLLFCVENKMFSFRFPLQIQIEPEDNSLSIFYRDYFKIDNIISSLLVSVFGQEDIFEHFLEDIDKKILEGIIENEWNDVDLDSLYKLAKQLVLFEPGYLRYDYDKAHANGSLHPEHHLDIFFSSSVTMKLGLQKAIESEWMLDMLNILTECKYVM